MSAQATAGAPIRSGLTTAEWLLAGEVLLALAALGLWWHQFSSYSPEADVRVRVVHEMSDTQALRRIAVEDSSATVRAAAVSRISDQDALSAIATTDNAPLVRQAAISKLSDAALVARIARTDKSSTVRLAAGLKAGDQEVLGVLAVNDGDRAVRHAAIKVLTEPGALLRVAAHDVDLDLRSAAFDKLRAQDLEQAARQEPDPRRRLEYSAAARLLLAAEAVPSQHRGRVASRLIALPLRFADPLWTSRFGSLATLKLDWTPLHQGYSGSRGSHSVAGEALTLRASFARTATPLTAQWRSRFPSSTSRGHTWEPASIDPADALIPWLVGQGAALAQFASEDRLPSIRKAAIAKLSDRVVLERIAQNDADPDVRAAAKSRLGSVP